ncbi:helix-turn-helix domain-containing protein [Lactobacillus johnsonii]|uniref:helix-turn-helix domain-containing protein n=1 Tax=Lactobacillus johnsonii TaxID=33959 RepID=UPI003D045E9E
MTTFERIKKLAKEHGMTLNEVNDKANLGTRSIYRWKYTEPSYNSLKKVARVFNMTPDELTGASTDKDKTEGKIQWKDLDMPYGGTVPDELKDYYKAMAEQYIKQHPEILKKRDDK